MQSISRSDQTKRCKTRRVERVASRVTTRYTGAARQRDPASISPDLLTGTPISPCTNGTLHARQMEKQQERTKVLGSTRHQTSGATGNDQQGLNTYNSVVWLQFNSFFPTYQLSLWRLVTAPFVSMGIGTVYNFDIKCTYFSFEIRPSLYTTDTLRQGYSITNSVGPDFPNKKFSWARHFQQQVMTKFGPTQMNVLKYTNVLLTVTSEKLH